MIKTTIGRPCSGFFLMQCIAVLGLIMKVTIFHQGCSLLIRN